MAAVTALLEARGLTKVFDGLTAVDRVDLRLEPGEIRALIGPNGAGKTTLVGLLCGRHAPTAGRIRFQGTDVTALPAWRRARLGIAYAFQLVSICRGLTVYDNVALAIQRRLLRRPWHRLVLPRRWLDPRVEDALARVGLSGRADAPAGTLPYGHQRLLELAMVLALEPRLLALDEPTQGLAPDETAALCDLLRALARHVTVLLVEHNVPVVLELATRVTVMDRGRVLAEGAPGEIERHPEVQRAYLGPRPPGTGPRPGRRGRGARPGGAGRPPEAP